MDRKPARTNGVCVCLGGVLIYPGFGRRWLSSNVRGRGYFNKKEKGKEEDREDVCESDMKEQSSAAGLSETPRVKGTACHPPDDQKTVTCAGG